LKGLNMKKRIRFTFCGDKWLLRIRPQKKMDGFAGRFFSDDKIIYIDRERLNTSTLLHELFEAALREQGCDYQAVNRNNHDDMLYVMTHIGLSSVARDVWGALIEIQEKINVK